MLFDKIITLSLNPVADITCMWTDMRWAEKTP